MQADDLVKILFSENPGVVIQVADKDCSKVKKMLEDMGIGYVNIGHPCEERTLSITREGETTVLDIDRMRAEWYRSSHPPPRHRPGQFHPSNWHMPAAFTGKLSRYGLNPDRREKSGIRAAIIREKGTNGEREMAYMLYLAGFDVKDVMMTDLVSGRETLDDVNFIVFCGGFSNSDVLGSAKGWAGAFLYNPRAKETLDRFYAREDTLSLGVCNGCQLMMELGLVGRTSGTANGSERPHMEHNDSHKFESAFLGVDVQQGGHSVLLDSLGGSSLGLWVAHGEGKFVLPGREEDYNVVLKYAYEGYPANPNGSSFGTAGIASADGRHLAMMPHLERAFLPWQCAYYPAERLGSDQVTPWIEAFVNARKWVEQHQK